MWAQWILHFKGEISLLRVFLKDKLPLTRDRLKMLRRLRGLDKI